MACCCERECFGNHLTSFLKRMKTIDVIRAMTNRTFNECKEFFGKWSRKISTRSCFWLWGSCQRHWRFYSLHSIKLVRRWYLIVTKLDHANIPDLNKSLSKGLLSLSYWNLFSTIIELLYAVRSSKLIHIKTNTIAVKHAFFI